MNKAELVEHVAKAAELTKKSAEEAVDAFRQFFPVAGIPNPRDGRRPDIRRV